MHGCSCLRALTALEKAPMWAVQVVRHVRHSDTLADVQVAMAHDTRCEQRQKNEIIRFNFYLF